MTDTFDRCARPRPSAPACGRSTRSDPAAQPNSEPCCPELRARQREGVVEPHQGRRPGGELLDQPDPRFLPAPRPVPHGIRSQLPGRPTREGLERTEAGGALGREARARVVDTEVAVEASSHRVFISRAVGFDAITLRFLVLDQAALRASDHCLRLTRAAPLRPRRDPHSVRTPPPTELGPGRAAPGPLSRFPPEPACHSHPPYGTRAGARGRPA